MIYPALSTVAHPVEELNRAVIAILQSDSSRIVRKSFDTKFIRRASS